MKNDRNSSEYPVAAVNRQQMWSKLLLVVAALSFLLTAPGCTDYPDLYLVNNSERTIFLEAEMGNGPNNRSKAIPPKTGMEAYGMVPFISEIKFLDAKTGELLASKHLTQEAWDARTPRNTMVLEYPPLSP